MTRVRKSFIVSFSALVCVLISLVATLHSTRFHNFLFSVLGHAVGWKITALKSEIHILRGVILLRGLDAQDSKERIHITGDRVLLDLSSLSLIRGKIIVTNLEVDHPLIDISKIPPPAGPTPDFMTVLLPDVMNTLFKHFDESLILQNLVLDHVALHDFVLLRYDQKSAIFKNAVLRIATNFFHEIELEAHLEEASGLLPSLQSTDLDLVLSKSGLEVRKANFDLGKLQLSVTGEWKGSLEKGRVAAEGTLMAPTVLSEPLHFDIDAPVEKRLVTIKKLNARLGPATFEGKGTFEVEKRSYDLSFDAKDLALESIFQKMPSSILGPAKGVATVKGHFQGDLPDLKAKAEATIREFHHGVMHSRQVDGTIDFHWPELDFDADIKPGVDGRVQGHAKGGVAFGYLTPYRSVKAMLKTVDINFDNGSLQDILPTAKLSGKLKGELHLKGNRTSAEGPGHAEVTDARWFLGPVNRFATEIMFKIGGLILFTKTEYNAPGMEPILWPDTLTLDTSQSGIVRYNGRPIEGLELKGSYETKTDFFRIESLSYRRGGSDLSGSLSISGAGGLDAKLKGGLNLESLSAIPSLFRDMRGSSRLDLTMGGTTHEPVIRGTVDFLKDEIQLRGFPVIEEVEGRVTLEGPTIKPKLTGLLGDGRFALDGSFGMNKFKPERFDLTLKGSDLTYARPNAYRIDFDADLALRGTLPSPKLSGRIDIVDALYTKPFQLRALVLKAFEEESPAEEAEWDKAFEAWQLDLVVKHSGDLRIRNNIADIYLLADLQVGGTYGRPLIRGALTATEGKVYLFGDTFTLNEGRLEFIDPSHREPYLTITAEEDLPPLYTVFVELKGYLSNLQVNLTSTPGLPREDVLSLITTGHTQEELRAAGINRQSMGMGVLAGELTSAIEQPITRRTGLDVFRLEASESGQLSKVSVGKYVTDRLTLEFQSDFAPETAQRTVQANYYLTDNILLKGTRIWENNQGTGPRFNFNLSFRFRLF